MQMDFELIDPKIQRPNISQSRQIDPFATITGMAGGGAKGASTGAAIGSSLGAIAGPVGVGIGNILGTVLGGFTGAAVAGGASAMGQPGGDVLLKAMDFGSMASNRISPKSMRSGIKPGENNLNNLISWH